MHKIVSVCPSIPYEAGLRDLKKALGNRESMIISNKIFVKMVEIVVKNNYFKFNGIFKQPASCKEVVSSVRLLSLHIFFIWTLGGEKLESILGDLINIILISIAHTSLIREVFRF